MVRASVAAQLENLDQRLVRVEQILPTLATKEDLRREIQLAIEPLATKEELLATKQELRLEIREEGERSRRHMDVVSEALRSDIQLLAEHLAHIATKVLGK